MTRTTIRSLALTAAIGAAGVACLAIGATRNSPDAWERDGWHTAEPVATASATPAPATYVPPADAPLRLNSFGGTTDAQAEIDALRAEMEAQRRNAETQRIFDQMDAERQAARMRDELRAEMRRSASDSIYGH